MERKVADKCIVQSMLFARWVNQQTGSADRNQYRYRLYECFNRPAVQVPGDNIPQFS